MTRIIACPPAVIGEIEQGRYRSRTPPKSILQSLYSVEAKYIPVVWAPTPREGAKLVERSTFWFLVRP